MTASAHRHWPGSGALVDGSAASDPARRTTHVVGYLDGVLDPGTLTHMREVWSLLEFAATTDAAHGRAVRERMLWDSLRPAA